MHIVFFDQDPSVHSGGHIYSAGNLSDKALKGALHNEDSCCSICIDYCFNAR